jgi:hypothetical protein
VLKQPSKITLTKFRKPISGFWNERRGGAGRPHEDGSPIYVYLALARKYARIA